MMRRGHLLWIAVAVAVVALACWPATTRFGENYVWSSKRIPLYEKAVNFISRDLQLRRLAQEITAGTPPASPERLQRLFAWTGEHVRATPEGFPVIDDHILHVILRGYGGSDQRTEAFTVLAGYAGIEAAVARLLPPERNDEFLIIALVRLGGKTYVFDVVNALTFTDAAGRLADTEALLADPSLITARAPGRVVRGVPYEQYFLGLRDPWVFSRTDAQKLWPRLRQEVSRVFSARPTE